MLYSLNQVVQRFVPKQVSAIFRLVSQYFFPLWKSVFHPQVLYADAFNLHCFQTLTGTKFLMVVKPDTPDVDEVLRTL